MSQDNETTDERLGKPSASSFALDALCPGRQQLLQSLTSIVEVTDEDAERGIRLHAAWEKSDPSGLDAEDVEIYERGLDLEATTIYNWKAWLQHLGPAFREGPREERFYFHDSQGNVSASGRADRHYIAGDFVLICDFKSLWNRSLVPAELNWQARLLSVLVAREYGASHVRFAFLKAMFGKEDTVDYNQDDLKRAEQSIQQVLWESRQPDAQRRAGSHCRHCKANAACPEAASWAQLPTVQIINGAGEAITPRIAKELAEQLSLHDCVRIWSTQTARRNIEDAIKARLKAQPESKLTELGLTFGNAKILRPITDTQRAFEFLISVGVPIDKLWSVTKMSNEELANVIQSALGLSSKKEAQEWVRTKLAGCISSKETDRPIEKI